MVTRITSAERYIPFHPVLWSVTGVHPATAGSVQVRRAQRDDLTAVFHIEQAVFPQPWPFAVFRRFVGEPGFLVADDGGVVGYVVADTIVGQGLAIGHIKDLAVRPDRHGEGIGGVLLARAIDALTSRPIDSVKLEVRESNDRAISLYHRYGFVHRRTLPGYYADGENALVLVRMV